GTFAAILYWQVAGARWREVDESLQAAAQYLDVNLRRFPPHELEGRPPPPDDPFRPAEMRGRDPGRPPEGEEPFPPPQQENRYPPPEAADRYPGRPLPRPPDRERLLAELTLPRQFGPPGDQESQPTPYFVVRRHDGSVLKSQGQASAIV